MMPWPHMVLNPSLCMNSTPKSAPGVTGSVRKQPYMSACPRGSHIRVRRTASRCSSANRRLATIVFPGIAGTPPVTTRNGSPAVCASMVVIRCQCGGTSHAGPPCMMPFIHPPSKTPTRPPAASSPPPLYSLPSPHSLLTNPYPGHCCVTQ
jgi:hypothetical protein